MTCEFLSLKILSYIYEVEETKSIKRISKNAFRKRTV